MQIPDEIRKCVAFLACKRKSGYVNGGTVFFVGYPLTVDERTIVTYAVTARHVIEDLDKRSDGYAHCRMNTRKGGFEFLPIPISKWVYSDDSRVDVAIAPVPLGSNKYDHKCLPLTMFLTPEMISQQELGIGDDLFFPGLFTQRPGEERNLPIVRIGNIAGMPEESVTTQCGVLRPPYLVEARSLGGLSGSPVFWHPGSTRTISGDLNMQPGSPFFLLGLVHGHYVKEGGTWDTSEMTLTDGLNSNSANMGIAIVVPANDIRATLNHPSLENARTLMNLSRPVPDTTITSEPTTGFVTQEHATPQTETDDLVSHSADTLDDSAERRSSS